MYKRTESIINIIVATGQTSNSVRFTPPSGTIIACAIFTNGGANAGFVTAKISNDSGEIISEATDIRNYRDREGGSYIEAKKPLCLQATGGTYVLDIQSTAAFTSDLRAQLVLCYQEQEINPSC